MSTIASPRPSISLSSRRESVSTDNTVRSASTSRPPASNTGSSIRRNRTALRDYYNLQVAATPTDARETPTTPVEETSELDRADFNAESYVQSLLAREGLEGVLRVQAGLVSAIRSLDGEKKALVYDNYSKLIAATDTIRSMREKMDPLTPGTSELTGQIEQITEMAEGLAGRMRSLNGGNEVRGNEEARRKKTQQETVKWVLGASQRLTALLAEGRRDEAQAEWRVVSSLLDRWEGVDGVEGVRSRCRQVMEAHEEG